MASEPKTRRTDVPPEAFVISVPHAGRRADAQATLTLLQNVTGSAR